MASVPSSKRTPGLALAVVVGRPDDERGVAAGDTDAFRALQLDAAPHAHERVVLALAADGRLVRLAGQDARLVRQRHEDVHHRRAHLLEVAAADGVLEQRVAREDQVADIEGDHVVGVARAQPRHRHL